METFIQLRLFATLEPFTPENADHFPVIKGCTVTSLLESLKIPPEEAKLVFINSVRAEPETIICGGEQISIFPPVGGG